MAVKNLSLVGHARDSTLLFKLTPVLFNSGHGLLAWLLVLLRLEASVCADGFVECHWR